MLRQFISPALLGLLVTAAFAPVLGFCEEPSKPKIGIMKFNVSEGLAPSVGTFLYDSLLTSAVNSGKYTVVDWEEIDRILKYLATSQPNLSPDEARKQAISQLGISKMFVGSVVKLGTKFQVTVKILNLDLSVDKAVSESAVNEDVLADAISKISTKLSLSSEEIRKIEQARGEAEAKRRAQEEAAKAKLKESTKKAEEEAQLRERDERAWALAKSHQTKESMASYLREYPNGLHYQEATENLESMKQEEDARIQRRQNISGIWCVKNEPVYNVTQNGTSVRFRTIGYGQVYAGTFRNGEVNARGPWNGESYEDMTGTVSEDGNALELTLSYIWAGQRTEATFVYKRER